MRNPNEDFISKLANGDRAARERYEYLIRTAQRNYCEGIVEEPRGFYDVIAVPPGDPGTIAPGNPDVFRNGEQFPIRLTHMVAAMRAIDTVDAAYGDPRQIQRVGLRMTFHDQAYMGDSIPFAPLPLWANKVCTSVDVLTLGTASWRFDRPFILSARDSMRVQVALEAAPAANNTRTITVSFSGIGILSRRPYFLSASAARSVAATTTLPTDDFRNDGTEPIVITDMTVHVSAESRNADPTGNITVARVQINQIGNGSRAEWFTGPLDVNGTGNPLPECPAMLLGIDTQAVGVVHRFPGDGLIWEPGEGIDIDLQGVNGGPAQGGQGADDAFVAIGLFGYIAIS